MTSLRPTGIERLRARSLAAHVAAQPADLARARWDEAKRAVADFRSASQNAVDADVKQFASKTLPTVEEHLKQAQDTEKALHPVTSQNTTTKKGAKTPSSY